MKNKEEVLKKINELKEENEKELHYFKSILSQNINDNIERNKEWIKCLEWVISEEKTI